MSNEPENIVTESTGPPETSAQCTCGAANSSDSDYCSDCGLPLKQVPEAEVRIVSPEEPTTFPISICVSAELDLGLAKDAQEDACLVQRVFYPDRDPEYAVVAMIGADGIGGSGDAGEVLSQTAVHIAWAGVRKILPYSERFAKFLETASRDQCWEVINNALRGTDKTRDPLLAQVFWANSCVRNFAKSLFTPEQFEAGGFGCTFNLVVAVFDLKLGRITIHGYNEGDAPIFLIIDQMIEQLSVDHAETQGEQSFISRWLGRSDTPGGHRFERTIEPGYTQGTILTCSDGLSNMLSPQSIVDICSEHANPTSLLISNALYVSEPFNAQHKPGDDNIFVTATSFVRI